MNEMTEMQSLVFATNNSHKLKEIRELLQSKILVLSLADIGCFDEIPEEKPTLEGNASQKAFFIYDKYGVDCFSDDTGLEIEALNGEPGVYSARYAGDKCTFEDNMRLVLKKMNGIKNRLARFRTVIAYVANGELHLFEGIVLGSIINEKKGQNGFGYDPIFMPKGYDKTFAEMSDIEKNAISHRAIAVEGFIKHIM